jgi:MFS family permease
VENSRREEAFTLLASTRPVEEARAEIEQIERIVAQPVDRHELRARWVRPALVVGIGLAILTQLSGNNVISYYAPTILTGLGLGSSVAILATVGLGAVKVIFVVFGLALIDKVGRKALLIIGSLGMGLSLVGLAIAAQAAHPNPALLVFFMALFLAANEIGWGPTFWVLMGEIFPLRVRGAAMGMSSMTVWVATAVVSFAFPPMLAGIGLSTSMWVFAVFNLLAVLFGWRFVRETKGRTLEAIELELQTAGNAIIEPAQPVTAAGPRTEAAAARDAKGQA